MITLVLPAYNEADGITQLLHRARLAGQEMPHGFRVIVVDDGSRDGTPDLVRSFSGLDCTLIQHETNLGLSAAMRSGLQAAAEMSERDDIIVTMDADDTHPPAFIKHMADRICQGYDIVVASRYQSGARVVGVSAFRQRLSDGASLLFRLLFPIKGLRDYTCGFRAYRAGLMQDGFNFFGSSFIDQPGFSCMADLLLKLSVFDPLVTEIPFLLRYDRKQGASKMQVRRTVMETIRLMLKRRFTLKRPALPVSAESGETVTSLKKAA